MATPPPVRTIEEAQRLFEKLEERFPTESLGHERWYLVAVGKPSYLLTMNKEKEFKLTAATLDIQLDRIRSSRTRSRTLQIFDPETGVFNHRGPQGARPTAAGGASERRFYHRGLQMS